jgi:hypothetical protein
MNWFRFQQNESFQRRSFFIRRLVGRSAGSLGGSESRSAKILLLAWHLDEDTRRMMHIH